VTLAQHGMMGNQMGSVVDLSYLADSVVLFRYFEAMGEIKQAISVVKKRSGMHERAIRELLFSDGKISVGQPLKQFQGIMTGVPQLAAAQEAGR
jgi:circadian clock protein KaiC